MVKLEGVVIVVVVIVVAGDGLVATSRDYWWHYQEAYSPTRGAVAMDASTLGSFLRGLAAAVEASSGAASQLPKPKPKPKPKMCPPKVFPVAPRVEFVSTFDCLRG